MKSPCTTSSAPDRTTPIPPKFWITRPSTVLLSAWTCNPRLWPMLEMPEPSITINGTALSPVADVLGREPGWVYPSMITGLVIGGNAEMRADHLRARAGDVEGDGVGAPVRVGHVDRLPQGAGALVGDGRDDDRREQEAGFDQRRGPAESVSWGPGRRTVCAESPTASCSSSSKPLAPASIEPTGSATNAAKIAMYALRPVRGLEGG